AGWAVVATAVLLIAAVATTSGYKPVEASPQDDAAALAPASAAGDWPYFGNSRAGTFFSPLTGINRANVGTLRVAWTTALGPFATRPKIQTQSVGIKVGDSLYYCSAFNDVFALAADSGKIRWRYDSRENSAGFGLLKCR